MNSLKDSIVTNLISFYSLCFSRKFFLPLNKKLFYFGARGLGILNHQTDKLSGEENFLRKLAKFYKGKITIFDVGANIGHYTEKLRGIFSNSIIYAFEPHP